METYDLDGVELKTLLGFIFDSLGPADEVVEYLKKKAHESNITFK